ncbi:MAG: putative flap endonuclease-1-like 5' DNA nuclease [Planctomycetota bacterium]|jgi:predicted flap endonuclease-1-like 5' DNA nuclease
MTEAIEIQALIIAYGPIFLLMLSTFILGYVLAALFAKQESKKALSALSKELKSKNEEKSLRDIETIFTEIRPKIIDIVKESQQQVVPINISMPKPDIAEKAKSTYVSFKKQTPKLNQSVIASGRLDMPDDLTKIEGIGPYIEERLNNIGIYNYDQISKLEVSDIRIITELIEFFPGRIERDNWVKQANALILYRSKL